ncbi:MAG TPA: ATP-binding cassette domain-containing protein [Acidimicrobiales bacterium]|jgi:daunorubicin resistance ABC transporter ATP-binding subunit|nr:ATP-binding cassette domain-containing protein [Acidimicrobiales bacterium]
MSDSAIRVEGLTKRFGSVVALGGIDFDVPTGSVFGLLGPNGAGKTTAVRILTTIIPPTEGRASVLGLDVVRDAETVRARIGLAGQYAAVDENLTARENLRMIGRLTQLPRKSLPARADELLERFDLVAAADRPVKTFSGGMRRRLDLGAALVHRPQVLFLDEPTTGLDPRGRTDLWGVIAELVAEGTTLLLTTQYLEEADRLAHRIAVVDGGKVIAQGTAAELKADLGATVVEVGFNEEADAVKAQGIVAPFATNDAGREGTTVRLEVSDGPRALRQVLSALDADDLSPVAVALRDPSLDDVFLSLTGHHAEPVAASGDGQSLIGDEGGS